MGIKYIGRTTTYCGKPLWEILANLKDFGVGRMVTRQHHLIYPEPSYLRILKVAALPNNSTGYHDPRKVTVLVEKVFRGQKWNKHVQIDSVSYKPDYLLVPKDEETKFTNGIVEKTCKILPRTVDFPPLMQEILRREAQKNGVKNFEVPKLQMKYNFTNNKNYRVAKENETPNVEIKLINNTRLYLDNTEEKAL